MVKNNKKWLTLLFLLVAAFIIVNISCGMAFTIKDLSLGVQESATSDLKHFSDVTEKDWFFLDVNYVCNNNLMNGTSNVTFSPDIPTTRGMIVTILWRLEGEPKIKSETTFLDVNYDTYYYNAVMWAAENRIVSGYDEEFFGPEDATTREQLATMIYRYAIYKGYDVSNKTSLIKYTDINQVSKYALSALEWASANEIITGTSEYMLMPQEHALRCQVAAILKRFCVQVVNSTPEDTEEMTNDSKNTNSKKDDTTEDSKNDGAYSNSIPSVSTGDKTNSEDDQSTKTNKNEYPLISINSTDAKTGDIVQVTIDLKNNPGILGMALSIYYDESKCSLQSVEIGEAFKDILDMTTSKTLESGVKVVWDGVDISQDNIKDGTILIMNYKINDTATPGKSPITVKYFDGDVVNRELENVQMLIENGYINILSI